MSKVLAKEPSTNGICHFSGAPDVSQVGFARTILDIAGREMTVKDNTTADYPTPAKRPVYSRLDCTSTEAVFGVERPDWHTVLAKMLAPA